MFFTVNKILRRCEGFLCLKRYLYFLSGFQGNALYKNHAVLGRKGQRAVLQRHLHRRLFPAKSRLGKGKTAVKHAQCGRVFCYFHGAEAAV